MKLTGNQAVSLKLEILRVLKNNRGNLLSSYQIFEKLPKDLKDLLISIDGESGRESGEHWSPACRIGKYASELCNGNTFTQNSTGVLFSVSGKVVQPGSSIVTLYKL